MSLTATAIEVSYEGRAAQVRVLSRQRRRQKRVATHVMGALLIAAMAGCCQQNDPNCRNLNLGPSTAEVVGVAIGVGAVVATAVAVEVHHAHHTLKGCVAETPGGTHVQIQSGTTAYVLSGKTANVNAGQKVRLHGSRVKRPKHSTTDPTFLVDRVTKDYGACK